MTMTVDPVRIDTLDLPLAGLTEANIRLNFGAGEMHLHQAPPGKLVAGTFEGGLINRSRSSSDIELSPLDPHDVLICGHPRSWDLGITSEIPVDLRLDTGANQALLDLSALRIRQLDFHTARPTREFGCLPRVKRSSTSIVAWRRSLSRCRRALLLRSAAKCCWAGRWSTKRDFRGWPVASGSRGTTPWRPTASTSPFPAVSGRPESSEAVVSQPRRRRPLAQARRHRA